MSMRYWIALALTVAVVIAVWTFCRLTRSQFVASAREVIQRELQNPDHNPQLDQLARQLDAGEPLQDVGIELPESMVLRITIADALSTLWWIWLPLTAGVAFGAAWLLGPGKSGSS
jgi:hypothetical protein